MKFTLYICYEKAIDSLYRNLLILNQNCWSYLKMYSGSGFLRQYILYVAYININVGPVYILAIVSCANLFRKTYSLNNNLRNWSF